jgi:aspartate aminotransferase-like enzyme
VVNLFSPGDCIVAASIGLFSERMAVIGEKHGLSVIRIAKEWGTSIKADEVCRILNDDGDQRIKAVCLPQNETTSGVVNDIRAVAEAMARTGHPAIIIVDAVSSLACVPLETDSWGLDLVVSGSQKGLMLPPGLGFVSIGPRAWQLVQQSSMPRWYWDYKAVKDKQADLQFPYTPPTSLLFGLKEALSILAEEGLEKVWYRHSMIATAVRKSAEAMGLALFSEVSYESDAVTAIHIPDGIRHKDLANLLRTKYGVIIGGGLERLQGKIFRIGHMGAIHMPEVFAIMGSVEMALKELGYAVELGTANTAASQVLMEMADSCGVS